MFQFRIRSTLHLRLHISPINQLIFCQKLYKMNKKQQLLTLKCCVTLQKRSHLEQMKKCTSLNIWKRVIVIIIETFHRILRWRSNLLTKSIWISRSSTPRMVKPWSIRIIFKHFVRSLRTKEYSRTILEIQSLLLRALNNSLGSPKERRSQTSTWTNGINI